MLIAGQTGGGKSTLLRQIITSLLLNHKNVTLQLIDLKEGLEFQIFKNIRNVEVIEKMEHVTTALTDLNDEMNQRMTLLKDNKCKDIDAFKKLVKKNRDNVVFSEKYNNFERKFIVIDEAAEIFLGGAGQDLKDVQLARKAISRISRLGRACGLHLIIATQRPDVKALDPQVKANLTSVVSFPMANIASSMTVLGSGRAEKLPPVAGRAIFKTGNKLQEIQTPFLDDVDAINLIKHLEMDEEEKAKVEASKKSSNDKSEVKKYGNRNFS